MVSGTLIKKRAGTIIIRILLSIVILVLGMLTALPFFEFIQNVFDYQSPSGFFGYAFTDWELAWVLAMIFWSGIIFGSIGKKTDYIFISVFLIFGFWGYLYTENVTPQMYLGLIGVALLGNTIGYMLKIGRRNWFGR